ncbi:MAG: ABC transporter ATP-binding protein [Rhodothermaceae bacterium]|nr:ABC transporter ATP-binding protein [Rhodothermaceae bacterium]
MIEINNLKKSFGPTLIWENVNLTIEDAETLAIIGKSGSGKSVLMKHINALMVPDEGTVSIDGKNINELSYVDLRLVRQKFGILFQGAALFDSITAFENVAFPLRYFTRYKEEKIKKRVMECLEMVNLGDIGDKTTAELSGGMRKRVGLARAIVLEPDYLLYDEPTSGLDPETSDEINDLIIHMSENLEITSIVVSHDMHSVLRVADKAAFLDEQKLSWYGTIDELRISDHKRLQQFVTASEYSISDENTRKGNHF